MSKIVIAKLGKSAMKMHEAMSSSMKMSRHRELGGAQDGLIEEIKDHESNARKELVQKEMAQKQSSTEEE